MNTTPNNKWAYAIAAAIVAAIFLDVVIENGATVLFLSKKFMDLLIWVTFWR